MARKFATSTALLTVLAAGLGAWSRRRQLADALRRAKHRGLVWLVENHPMFYLRLKGLDNSHVAKDQDFLRLHAALLEEKRGIQTLAERFNLATLVRDALAVEGDLAEVGVFQGGSAKIIAHYKGARPLHLCDTFTGLPEVDADRDGEMVTGGFSETSLADVRRYLGAYSNVHFYAGEFPGSAAGTDLAARRYCFVHLDVDLHRATTECLEFFYPRMTPGGIILSHDYGHAETPGVKQAFDTFFRDKPEPLIKLWDSQCAVVKMP